MTNTSQPHTLTSANPPLAGASHTVCAARKPVAQVDRRRVELSSKLDPEQRRRLGQFMTPASVARYMATLFGAYSAHVRLLDAGAGLGSLTAAFVEAVVSASTPPQSIDVTAFEIDPVLAAVLEVTLASCAELCAASGIAFSSRIVEADYIKTTMAASGDYPAYNCAILNPPYGKIPSRSEARGALDVLGVSASNFYSAFVSLALAQLAPGGELVAITPRSYCNGAMHRAFRSFLLGSAALTALHLYGSRSAVFDGEVLQEVVVMKLRKSAEQETLLLSSDTAAPRALPVTDIVGSNAQQQVIRFPLEADNAARHVAGLPCTLSDLGLQVSTGRVMEHRTRPHLRNEGETGSVRSSIRSTCVTAPSSGRSKASARATRWRISRRPGLCRCPPVPMFWRSGLPRRRRSGAFKPLSIPEAASPSRTTSTCSTRMAPASPSRWHVV